MTQDTNTLSADLDGDGKISEREREFHLSKIESNEKMAWISFLSIIVAGVYIIGFAPETRLERMGNTADWFFIALLSIIGFHYGVQGIGGMMGNFKK